MLPLLAAIACIACASAPPPLEPIPEPAPTAVTSVAESPKSVEIAPVSVPLEEPAPIVEPPPKPAFDPASVSTEVKTAAIADIRALIENLNKIIQHQDYEAWLSHLTPEFIAYYSDPTLLAKYSDYPILKRQGIKLNNLRDYFVFLVYPSRQNDRVDDIEYTSENLVKAITMSPKGSRDILYILEKHGDAWKIGIGR